mmetsp:Transcript_115592/g.200692  ORF Transcript_115592/g.200692 Transcript_115592/m.200692 type:complete len:322 (+) Transcript_115592:2234-3199(+)
MQLADPYSCFLELQAALDLQEARTALHSSSPCFCASSLESQYPHLMMMRLATPCARSLDCQDAPDLLEAQNDAHWPYFDASSLAHQCLRQDLMPLAKLCPCSPGCQDAPGLGEALSDARGLAQPAPCSSSSSPAYQYLHPVPRPWAWMPCDLECQDAPSPGEVPNGVPGPCFCASSLHSRYQRPKKMLLATPFPSLLGCWDAQESQEAQIGVVPCSYASSRTCQCPCPPWTGEVLLKARRWAPCWMALRHWQPEDLRFRQRFGGPFGHQRNSPVTVKPQRKHLHLELRLALFAGVLVQLDWQQQTSWRRKCLPQRARPLQA